VKGLQGTGLGFEFKRGPPLYPLAATSMLNFSVSSYARATSAAETIFRRVKKKKKKKAAFFTSVFAASRIKQSRYVRVKKRAEYIHTSRLRNPGIIRKVAFFREANREKIERAGS